MDERAAVIIERLAVMPGFRIRTPPKMSWKNVRKTAGAHGPIFHRARVPVTAVRFSIFHNIFVGLSPHIQKHIHTHKHIERHTNSAGRTVVRSPHNMCAARLPSPYSYELRSFVPTNVCESRSMCDTFSLCVCVSHLKY